MSNDTLTKLSGALPIGSSLDGHADELYRSVGKRLVAIVELRVDSRLDVDETTKRNPIANLVLDAVEVAWDSEDEAHVRTLMQEIFRARTADGTFDSVDPGNGEVHRTAQDGDAAIPITGAGRRKPSGGGGRGPRG